MLAKLEVLSLNPMMREIAIAVEERDYQRFKSKAHNLKGASGYVGAAIIHYTCYHIQQQFQEGNLENMLEFYPLLVEASIEFQIVSRIIIAKYHSKCPTSCTHGKCPCMNSLLTQFACYALRRQGAVDSGG